MADHADEFVHVDAGGVTLEGNLSVPGDAAGVVLFAHGSGSSRHSPRNRQVAEILQEAGLATLLIDLLTVLPDQFDEYVWFDRSEAVHPLDRTTAPKLPARHPFLPVD